MASKAKSVEKRENTGVKTKKVDGRLVRGARAKAAILSAAIDIFSEKGFDGAQTSEVAKAAGYAESTVFLHFKNKHGLVLAIMQDFYQNLMSGANIILATTSDGEEQLVALVQHYLVELMKCWRIVRLFATIARYTEDETLAQFMEYNRAYTGLYIDIFEKLKSDQVFREDVDVRLLRDMLFGTIEHYALANLVKVDAQGIGAFIEKTFAILFHGAKVAPSPVGASLDNEGVEKKLDEILALLASPGSQ